MTPEQAKVLLDIIDNEWGIDREAYPDIDALVEEGARHNHRGSLEDSVAVLVKIARGESKGIGPVDVQAVDPDTVEKIKAALATVPDDIAYRDVPNPWMRMHTESYWAWKR